MTEWLNQYERVAQRQQEYLQKIRDLRQRLQTRDERFMMLAIERMRHVPRDLSNPLQPPMPNPNYKSHVPLSSSLLTHSFFPKTSSPSPRLLESPDGISGSEGTPLYSCMVSGERLHPRAPPKRLTPISRTSRVSSDRGENSGKSSGPGLERNKTDYEPIEDIAKRNRIQFSRYLSSRDGKTEETDKPGRACAGPTGSRRQVLPLGASRPLSTKAVAGDDTAQREV
ncbi:hypothetical protein BaRGS_00016790, partial [Batillaria attramentaria]|nr:hypothetical protein BaRGS_034162 [Batillaria attramentaria]